MKKNNNTIIPHIPFCKEYCELDGYKKNFIKYLDSINISLSDWQRLTDMERKTYIFSLRNNLCGLGYTTIVSQDKKLRSFNILPEILAEYRRDSFDIKYNELKLCNSVNEIKKDKFLQECPIGAEVISMMNERLVNDCSDGIMNNLHFYKFNNGDFALIHYDTNMPNTKAVFSDDCVFACSGALKVGNQGLNEVINTRRAIPNIIYFIDGRSMYEHDTEGRLVKESTVYTKNYKNKSGRDSNNSTFIRKVKNGKDGDESSHSVPHSLGGPNEAINQTPMSRNINGEDSEWCRMEGLLRNAVELGIVVYSEHDYYYQDKTARPTKIKASIRLMDSPEIIRTFENK